MIQLWLVLQLVFTHTPNLESSQDLNQSYNGEIPSSGTYEYDIAFAEWDGISMGQKVTVIINQDSVKVIYHGETLSLTKPGDVLDAGLLRKHQSGVWIIAHKEDDIYIEEIGGCTGGPSVIDFKEKKFWLC